MRPGAVAGIGLSLGVAASVGAAQVPVPVETEPLAFDVGGAVVSGEIRFPPGRSRGPIVLILHSSPGFDGRGAFYAEALNRAGIATVEIDYLHGKGIPRSPGDNLPQVYETLRHLARHERVDRGRIGVMGFSWGGVLALLTSSRDLTRVHAGDLAFAAHLGLYPICWRHLAVLEGVSAWFDASVYRAVTGSPVHIVAGGRDAIDGPDSCQRFIAALPPAAARSFQLTTYPEATFGWDSRFGSAAHDIAVDQGRGGINRIDADPAIAARSRQGVVDYFVRTLKAD